MFLAQFENVLQGVIILSLITVDNVDYNFPLWFVDFLVLRLPRILQKMRDQGIFRVSQERRRHYGDMAGETGGAVSSSISGDGEVRETVAGEISRGLDRERVLPVEDRI